MPAERSDRIEELYHAARQRERPSVRRFSRKPVVAMKACGARSSHCSRKTLECGASWRRLRWKSCGRYPENMRANR